MRNPWKLLGVHRKSTDEEIRAAFLTLAKKHHPDALKTAKGSPDMFPLVNWAHTMLKNSKVRNELLATLKITAKPCAVCTGAGCTSRSKSFHQKIYTACKVCCGAGYIIKETENEGTIELRGTDGIGSKGRNNKRRP